MEGWPLARSCRQVVWALADKIARSVGQVRTWMIFVGSNRLSASGNEVGRQPGTNSSASFSPCECWYLCWYK